MNRAELDARSMRAVESLDLAERVLPGLRSTLSGLQRYRAQALRAAGVDSARFALTELVGNPARQRELDAAMAKGRRVLTRRGHPLDRPHTWPPYFWEPSDRFACVACGEPGELGPLGLQGVGGVCRYPEDPNQDDQGLHVFRLAV